MILTLAAQTAIEMNSHTAVQTSPAQLPLSALEMRGAKGGQLTGPIFTAQALSIAPAFKSMIGSYKWLIGDAGTRLALLQDRVNSIMTRLDLPRAKFVIGGHDDLGEGAYRQGTGVIELATGVLTGPATTLVNIVLHELTHLEQDVLRISRAVQRLKACDDLGADLPVKVARLACLDHLTEEFLTAVMHSRDSRILSEEECNRADRLTAEAADLIAEKFSKAFCETLIVFLPEKIDDLLSSPAASAREHLNQVISASATNIFARNYLNLPEIRNLLAGQRRRQDELIEAEDRESDWQLRWDLITVLESAYKNQLACYSEHYTKYRNWASEAEAWQAGEAVARVFSQLQ